MGIGYLLGGVACLLYAVLVGYFGGIKKSPGLLKLVKMKISKNMSDDASAIISLGSSRSCASCWPILVYIWSNTRHSLIDYRS
jgi:hypothetical protein